MLFSSVVRKFNQILGKHDYKKLSYMSKDQYSASMRRMNDDKIDKAIEKIKELNLNLETTQKISDQKKDKSKS